MIKAAIFDIDGTILDSMSVWDDMGAGFLERKNIQADKEKLKRILLPMSLSEGASWLKENFSLAESVEEIMNELLEEVKGFYDEEVQLKPGAFELLSAIEEAGVPAAAATANDSGVFRKAFKRLGIDGFFKDVISCQDVGAPKGEPLIYEKTAELLGAGPSDTAVFEDSARGLGTAEEAGFITVGVYDSHSSRDQEKIMETADLYVKSLEENDRIMRFLKNAG